MSDFQVPLLAPDWWYLGDENGDILVLDAWSIPPEPRSPTTNWTVDLCQGWLRIGETDAFEFKGHASLNEQGEFVLVADQRTVHWGYRLVDDEWLPYAARDVDTIRLVRPNGTIAFAGFVAPADSGTGGLELFDDGVNSTASWSGPDLWDVMTRRIVYPDPDETPAWTAVDDTRSGAASTVAAEYIMANAGATALADRQVPGLTVTDRQVGTTVTVDWSRLQTLSSLVARLCVDAGIVCRPTVDFDGTIDILLTSPLDVSSRYVFSDQQDLASKTGRRVPASITYTVAGGQGDGTGRVFRVSDTGITGLNRREVFYDQASISDAGLLQQAANVSTQDGRARWFISAEVAETLSALVLFGGVINIGDFVTVEVDGERVRVQITGAVYEVTPDKQVVRPILGDAEPNYIVGLKRDVANLADRFGRSIA